LFASNLRPNINIFHGHDFSLFRYDPHKPDSLLGYTHSVYRPGIR
ncbi:MAG: hypothetical protein BECKG1743D_GA0114223_110233, partial [Candidatus Kentron sp. G]